MSIRFDRHARLADWRRQSHRYAVGSAAADLSIMFEATRSEKLKHFGSFPPQILPKFRFNSYFYSRSIPPPKGGTIVCVTQQKQIWLWRTRFLYLADGAGTAVRW